MRAVVRSGDSSTAATSAAVAQADVEETAFLSSNFVSQDFARKLARNKFGMRMRRISSGKVLTQADPIRVDNQLRRVMFDVSRYKITAPFFWNADEAGYLLYSTRSETLEFVGAKDAPVNGAHQKEGATVMETSTMSGEIFERVVIFTGKTDKVLPANAKSTDGVECTFSGRHWMDAEVMENQVFELWKANAERLRTKYNKPNQVILLLLDVYWAHFGPVLEKLAAINIKVQPVEPGLTGLLQPCDQPTGVNRIVKPLVAAMNDRAAVARMLAQINGVSDSLKEAFERNLLPKRTEGSSIIFEGGDPITTVGTDDDDGDD